MDFNYVGLIGTRILFIFGIVALIVSLILNNPIIRYIGFGAWSIELIFGLVIFLIDFISERIN